MLKHKIKAKTNISDDLREFFYVEIRNENQGGIRPATLASALDSLEQAPDDVVAEWCGRANAIHYGTQGDVYSNVRAEIKQLIKTYGKSAALEDLLAGRAKAVKTKKDEKKHPITEWQYEVTNGDTRLGYDEWREHKAEAK